MTEEIIINGVDVSGCKYYEEDFCSRFLGFRIICEQDVCCDYKQYQLSEQRLEKLKAENAKLEAKLERIRNLASRYRSCYAQPILEIIEGAEDE